MLALAALLAADLTNTPQGDVSVQGLIVGIVGTALTSGIAGAFARRRWTEQRQDNRQTDEERRLEERNKRLDAYSQAVLDNTARERDYWRGRAEELQEDLDARNALLERIQERSATATQHLARTAAAEEIVHNTVDAVRSIAAENVRDAESASGTADRERKTP